MLFFKRLLNLEKKPIEKCVTLSPWLPLKQTFWKGVPTFQDSIRIQSGPLSHLTSYKETWSNKKRDS